MVSTHSHSQYISDFNNSTTLASADRSPLAMLAKTCETIGLSDAPSRKLTKEEKSKDGHSPSNISTSESKKCDITNSSSKKKDDSRSPHHRIHSPCVENRATPILCEPSTSTASFQHSLLNGRYPMFQSTFPNSFPAFYPSVMSFPQLSPFPTPFPAGTPFLRCIEPMPCKGCPTAMLQRPCATPGCTTCVMQNSGASAVDMLPFHPHLFPAYNPLMTPTVPSSTSASVQLAYQNMMAAATGHVSKNICNWIDPTNGICGKSFSTADELANHMKRTHVPSSSSACAGTTNETKSTSPRSSKSSALHHNSLRFHPYMKHTGNFLPGSTMPNPLTMQPFGLSGFPSPAAFQAIYRQGMLAAMPPQ